MITGWRARRRQPGVARAGMIELRLRWGMSDPFFFLMGSFFLTLCRTRNEWRKWGFVLTPRAFLYRRRSFKLQDWDGALNWECALFVHTIFDSVGFGWCWRTRRGGTEPFFCWALIVVAVVVHSLILLLSVFVNEFSDLVVKARTLFYLSVVAGDAERSFFRRTSIVFLCCCDCCSLWNCCLYRVIGVKREFLLFSYFGCTVVKLGDFFE